MIVKTGKSKSKKVVFGTSLNFICLLLQDKFEDIEADPAKMFYSKLFDMQANFMRKNEAVLKEQLVTEKMKQDLLRKKIAALTQEGKDDSDFSDEASDVD